MKNVGSVFIAVIYQFRKLGIIIFIFISLSAHAQFSGSTFICDDETFKLLEALSNSRLKGGDIFLFTTTHQDLGWLDHPEACIITRDTLWLTPFLQRLQDDPSFKMDIEQSSIVSEYIHRHPESKEKIEKYLHDKRICIGATYVQPYEEMYSGESLVRQFYFGKKMLADEFGGYRSLSYFNVDVPGRTLQMPQIMEKAGIKNMIISRHQRGLFNWSSPDGSKVRGYSPGHYIFFYHVLAKSDQEAVKLMAKEAVIWYTDYNQQVKKHKGVMPAMLNYEFLWDQKPVDNLVPFISKWNAIKEIQSPSGKKVQVNLPKFKYAIADEFFERLDQTTPQLTTDIIGERPNVWLYIHGPSHEKAITASRKGDILLSATEKILSFDVLTNQSFSNYPQQEINNAWKSKIYPDHGWGGKNGTITDQLFLQKFEQSLADGQQMLTNGLMRLSSKISMQRDAGIPITVFNTLSWKRDDVVSATIRLDKGYAKQVAVTSGTWESLPTQLRNVSRYSDGSIMSAELCFLAKDVPSLGYATFYITPQSSTPKSISKTKDMVFENNYYTINLGNGGIRQIYDKELNKDLLNIAVFQGGEIFTMKSVGSGAGEFDAIQQPTMEGFDKTSLHTATWTLEENGDMYTSYKFRSPIRYAVVEQTIRIYHHIKKIDFDVAIRNWEGILYREFRMALPVNANHTTVSYEVPFGTVTVNKDEMAGAAGERYNTENNKVHPRGIGDWISVSGQDFGVTMSSSVAVADWMDPTGQSTSSGIIQPVLLASRKSCHELGNEYLQYGDHDYHFSITSHAPGWQKGSRFGKASNEPLLAVVSPIHGENATLPASYSFFDIDLENVVVTAIKKCENDQSIIIRLYNTGNVVQQIDKKALSNPKTIIHTNLIEEELGKVDRIELKGYAIETFKLIF